MELFSLEITWWSILFYLLLIDSFGAVLVSFFGQRWYTSYLHMASEFFPPAKGWALIYCAMAILLVLTYHGYIG